MEGLNDSSVARQVTCSHPQCGATFTRQWRLKEHRTVHGGERPLQCPVTDCGRRFTRKAHLRRHEQMHSGVKNFRCPQAGCAKVFIRADKLKRHSRYMHGDRDAVFKCPDKDCTLAFRKRRAYKRHLSAHGVPPDFRCTVDGCSAKFESRAARRAHEKTHAGYSCPHPDCQVLEQTWGMLCKHARTHPRIYTCNQCKENFSKRWPLRRHKRTHALQKPVLLCPTSDCKAYFSTTFNLEHHIRKVHLQLLKYSCSFPDCTRTFAMLESLNRHLVCHDPLLAKTKQRKRQRSGKNWQKRLEGHHKLPLVEEDLSRLFALRMRLPRRSIVEAHLSGLFNERKIPRHVDPEVNLRDLFSLKAPRPAEVALVK